MGLAVNLPCVSCLQFAAAWLMILFHFCILKGLLENIDRERIKRLVRLKPLMKISLQALVYAMLHGLKAALCMSSIVLMHVLYLPLAFGYQLGVVWCEG